MNDPIIIGGHIVMNGNGMVPMTIAGPMLSIIFAMAIIFIISANYATPLIQSYMIGTFGISIILLGIFIAYVGFTGRGVIY